MDFCSNDAHKLDYINGLLSEKDRVRFEEHLAACPGCRREIEELENTAAAVADLTPPSVPSAWAGAAKERLQEMESSHTAQVPAEPIPLRRRTNIFLYAMISAGVTAVVVLLSWLVLGGAAHRWFPGLSTAGLGITEPRTARIIDLVVMILSLCSLMFVPSIIDNIYLLVRKGGRRIPT